MVSLSKPDVKKGADDVPTSIFSIDLVAPVAAVLVYLYFLKFTVALKSNPNEPLTPAIFMDDTTGIIFPISFTVIYLTMVFSAKRLMSGREPASVKSWMITYNTYQILLNTWMVIEFLKEVYTLGLSFWGNSWEPKSERHYKLAFLVWVHYANKYVELLDTVFMIVRKKFNQLSFLHCFHHVQLIWAWYLVVRCAPGADSYLGALANSVVHVIMYTYYLLKLLGVDVKGKQYITLVQLTQFVVCLVHAAGVYLYSPVKIMQQLANAQGVVMVCMLVLFGNFSYQQYIKKPQRGKQANTSSSAKKAK